MASLFAAYASDSDNDSSGSDFEPSTATSSTKPVTTDSDDDNDDGSDSSSSSDNDDNDGDEFALPSRAMFSAAPRIDPSRLQSNTANSHTHSANTHSIVVPSNASTALTAHQSAAAVSGGSYAALSLTGTAVGAGAVQSRLRASAHGQVNRVYIPAHADNFNVNYNASRNNSTAAAASATGPAAAAAVGGAPVSSRARRAREESSADAADLDGYRGPWAAFKGEAAAAAAAAVAPLSEQQQANAAAHAQKLKLKAAAARKAGRIPTGQSADAEAAEAEAAEAEAEAAAAVMAAEVALESTRFFGSVERDFRGRSFVDIPAGFKFLGPELSCSLPTKLINTLRSTPYSSSSSSSSSSRSRSGAGAGAGSAKGVSSVSYFPGTGHLLLSSSLDGTVRVWDAAASPFSATGTGMRSASHHSNTSVGGGSAYATTNTAINAYAQSSFSAPAFTAPTPGEAGADAGCSNRTDTTDTGRGRESEKPRNGNGDNDDDNAGDDDGSDAVALRRNATNRVLSSPTNQNNNVSASASASAGYNWEGLGPHGAATGAARARVLRSYTGHGAGVRSAVFSPDGRAIMTVSHDKWVKIWDTETGAVVSRLKHERMTPLCAAFHPNSTGTMGSTSTGGFDNSSVGSGSSGVGEVLTGMNEKVVLQWDTRAGHVTQKYPDHMAAVDSVTFLPNSSPLDDDDANALQGGLTSASAGGVRFVTTGDDKKMLLWEYGIPVVLKEIFETDLHVMPTVAVHPSGKYLVGNAQNNEILLFALQPKLKLNRRRRFTGHLAAGFACGMAFSPDGGTLVAGDAEGKMLFWDWRSGRMVKKVRAHDDVTIDVAWHPNAPKALASCSWDGSVKLWG